MTIWVFISSHLKSFQVAHLVFEKLQSQTQGWQTTYAALTTILLIDAAVAPTTRFSRPLRPIILVLSGGLRIWCLGFVHVLHMFHMCFTCIVWLLSLRSHALNLRISEHSKLLHDRPQNLSKFAESVGIAPSLAMHGFGHLPWCAIHVSLDSPSHTFLQIVLTLLLLILVFFSNKKIYLLDSCCWLLG